MTVRLLLDTTQAVLSLALANAETIFARLQLENDSQRYHSSMLLPELHTLLQQHNTAIADIDAIALNIGPGSFTGIRTGLTVAKTWGQVKPTLKIYAFDTFSLLAVQPSFRNHPITILLNAFRNQHYHAALQVDNTGHTHWLSSPHVLPNTPTPTIQTAYCLMGKDLSQTIQLDRPPLLLEDHNIVTPEAMQFLMTHDPERYQTPWASLLPDYLQLPHITAPKAPSH